MNLSLQMHILQQQQQLRKDVSYEITVNSPSQMWFKKVGLQKFVSCNACMETEGGCFERYL
jgi:hypothetical protein